MFNTWLNLYKYMPTQIASELLNFRDLVRWGATQFNRAHLHFGHGNTNAWDEALCLARYVLHLSPAEDRHIADARLLLSEREQIIDLFLKRIEERKPAAYIIQEAWFAGLSFYVDERVIIPRSPIGELIEQRFGPWIGDRGVSHILDLCTGSGCIAIASAFAFPEARVDAVDISKTALQVAHQNVLRHQVGTTVHLIEGDLWENVPRQQYQVIVSNPPYVDEQDMIELPPEYKHEPVLALQGGQDGLDIVKRILEKAADYLTDDGILVVEVGNSAAALEAQLGEKYPFTWLSFERGGEGVFLLTKDQIQS